jgi:hypothetical protein
VNLSWHISLAAKKESIKSKVEKKQLCTIDKKLDEK